MRVLKVALLSWTRACGGARLIELANRLRAEAEAPRRRRCCRRRCCCCCCCCCNEPPLNNGAPLLIGLLPPQPQPVQSRTMSTMRTCNVSLHCRYVAARVARHTTLDEADSASYSVTACTVPTEPTMNTANSSVQTLH